MYGMVSKKERISALTVTALLIGGKGLILMIL
jgi:hypothetical protein